MVTAEVGGPGEIFGQDYGYWLYAEVEDSGSYYRNSPTEQTILQASFDLNADRAQLQFGGMVHDFDGNEIGGWNRLTQDLIDHGIYVTGSPQPLDIDGDGYISHQEFDVDGDGFTDLNPFAAGLVPGGNGPARRLGTVPGCMSGSGRPRCSAVFPTCCGLQSPGTARLRGDQVLVDSEDVIRHKMTTLYFDAILVTGSDWEWRNQLFYEAYDHVSEVAYGFSDFHDASALENKLVLSKVFRRGTASIALKVSPSFRPHRLPSRQRLHQRVFRPPRSDASREQLGPPAAGNADRRRLHRVLHRTPTSTSDSRRSPKSVGGVST